MKHEFKTTKTTKNVNNLLPATDEELGLELLEFSEDMMLKGMEIALKKRTNIKKISVPPINDSFYEKAFSIIGKKHNIAAENVHKYIYILMQEMLAYSDEEMKRDLRKTVGDATGSGEKMPTLGEFILYMYGVTRKNKNVMRGVASWRHLCFISINLRRK